MLMSCLFVAVVDCGFVKMKNYHPKSGIGECLPPLTCYIAMSGLIFKNTYGKNVRKGKFP